jgi:calcium/calmodulin-dependent protein kinase I
MYMYLHVFQIIFFSKFLKKIFKKNFENIFLFFRENMTEDELQNLYNELNILSIVDHPNIVRVHEYYENEGIAFIIMEFMEGGELFDRIVQYEHYTERQASDSFRPIVDAVRYCHSLGICHRDLKVRNFWEIFIYL